MVVHRGIALEYRVALLVKTGWLCCQICSNINGIMAISYIRWYYYDILWCVPSVAAVCICYSLLYLVSMDSVFARAVAVCCVEGNVLCSGFLDSINIFGSRAPQGVGALDFVLLWANILQRRFWWQALLWKFVKKSQSSFFISLAVVLCFDQV